MIQTTSGCPPGWATGWRFQDNEDKRNRNWWSPRLPESLKITVGRDITTYYCTKIHEHDSGPNNAFTWPAGNYCIARYGGKCPTGFDGGYKYWDDENAINDNAYSGVLPDGVYNANTRVEYCCRNDGDSRTEIILPTTQPFALYLYRGDCQEVEGWRKVPFEIHFDDQNHHNKDECKGSVPAGWCSPDNRLHICYYV